MEDRKAKKYISILIAFILVIIVLLLSYRYTSDKQLFDEAEMYATKWVRMMTFDYTEPSETKYNPLTSMYYVYFDLDNGTQTTVSIDLTSKNENGTFDEISIN